MERSVAGMEVELNHRGADRVPGRNGAAVLDERKLMMFPLYLAAQAVSAGARALRAPMVSRVSPDPVPAGVWGRPWQPIGIHTAVEG